MQWSYDQVVLRFLSDYLQIIENDWFVVHICTIQLYCCYQIMMEFNVMMWATKLGGEGNIGVELRI